MTSFFFLHEALDEFEEYSNFVEDQLEKQFKKLEEELEASKEVKNRSYDDISDRDHLRNELERYRDNFANITRSSLILMIYAFGERQLVVACQEVAERKNKPFNTKGGNGSIIEKAKVYLESNASVDFNPILSEWEKFDNFRFIRNCFAHDSGEIDRSISKLTGAINSITGVDDMDSKIQLDNTVASQLQKVVGGILNLVYRSI